MNRFTTVQHPVRIASHSPSSQFNPLAASGFSQITPPPVRPSRSHVRHILLGSPEAVRQTIHLLHILRYTETGLWSRAIAIQDPLVIPPAPGEVISLLRKQV
ncbi:hypothetical protein [cf. Phormidesmis sp. LEGE 11477]|uniref:hypothetical protein n=1 Tax=cf. Phormidesmis sp. LEGE 11477 TaxID=1828680 RepID=UPI0018817911|nr:hypothetical protein [cf. Phormidesmis sp. LEGE 11477]MBE9062765.1 hypothetical protein [cf. Phormidesmis sp. LEGE 11477]